MSKELNQIKFHVYEPIQITNHEGEISIGKQRLCTLLYRKSQSKDNRIYLVYAVPHSKNTKLKGKEATKEHDEFNRKEANRWVKTRMIGLFPPGYTPHPVRSPLTLNLNNIKQYLPFIVTPVLQKYTNKTMRAFGLNKDVEVFFLSDSRKRDKQGNQDPKGKESCFMCKINIKEDL